MLHIQKPRNLAKHWHTLRIACIHETVGDTGSSAKDLASPMAWRVCCTWDRTKQKKDLKANLLKSAIKLPQNTYQKLHVNAGHLSNKDRYTSYLSDASHLKLDFPSRLRKLECQSIFASPTATLGCNRNFHCRFHRFIEAGITTKKTTSSTKNNDTEKILELSVN